MESKRNCPTAGQRVSIDDFIAALHTDDNKLLELSREMARTFRKLAAESEDQFLPTPISESLLRNVDGEDRGR